MKECKYMKGDTSFKSQLSDDEDSSYDTIYWADKGICVPLVEHLVICKGYTLTNHYTLVVARNLRGIDSLDSGRGAYFG